ncbi:cytochrome c oxidase subunit II [Sphingobium estronivorans]|uniref:cytochrome c oxidase subunit II n=1 Tax=Sphingobium estronivorans TaxID=1577690 RepID=UPI00123C755F|nr:cytochrome c oxidase subunit II [Sphingobium estronivorans]
MSHGFFLWPVQASHHAKEVDLLIGGFGVMVWLLTLPVFILIAVFVFRYRTGRDANRDHASGSNVWLEVSWSIIPFLLTLGFFVWATALYFDLRRPPAGAMTINLVARQWMWKYQHGEGAREINDLHVPVNRPVKLVMISQDVIHSVFVPALRIKQDVLPGRYTTMWFTADRLGIYPLRCAEFCGTDHSVMGGRLIVMAPQDYAGWLARNRDGGESETLAAAGARLFRSVGCSGCHGAASTVHAPPLDGLYGGPVGLSDGRALIADDQYLHDSIMLPNKDVAAGYRPIMPTYANVLASEQVNALVAYLKDIGAGKPGTRQEDGNE